MTLLTISSALQRLFHRVLGKRLTKVVDLNPYQRGFQPMDGALANLLTLNHYIKARRLQGKTYNVVSLDVRKAFDTVAHEAIFQGLIDAELDEPSVLYIMNSLKASTYIQAGPERTTLINLQRGVKQGDPLSPMLFNLVLDGLINKLNTTRPGGSISSNTRLAAIAFADDLVLIEDKDTDMAISLDMAERFLLDKGMALNPNKCVAISAATIHGKSVPRTRSLYKVGCVPVRSITDLQTFRYLGLSFTAAGASKPNVFNLTQWLHNILSAPLKPDQKYLLVRDFVVPRLFYGLQNPATNAAILSECDRLLRKSIKKIFHVPERLGSQFIHAKISDGGLGIPQLRFKIPYILCNRISILQASDPLTASILATEPSSSFHLRLSSLARRGNPDPYWKEHLHKRPFSRGLECAAEDQASRSWLSSKPRGWSGFDFVRAIQLRTASLPCKGLPSVPKEDRGCRAGCFRNESLCHILQGCKVTHFERIKRHNEIVKKVAKHSRRKGWVTEVESRIRHQSGQLFIPDLIVHKPDNNIIVADVQVCWEGPRTLAQSWARKQAVYDNIKFREAAQQLWPGKELSFLPILLGARGIWPRCNEDTEEALKIPKYLKESAVHSCMKWGSSIHRHFMSAVWRRLPPPRPPDRLLPPNTRQRCRPMPNTIL